MYRKLVKILWVSVKVSPEMFGMYIKATKQNWGDPPGMWMESSSNSRS